MIKIFFVVLIIITSFNGVTAQQPANFDALMHEYKLVDIHDIAPDILVELKYSTEDNFVGMDMYGVLEKAYFEKNFADRVVDAQKILKRRNSNYTLLIYDAARPISVQHTMYKCVKGTNLERFVANGTRGGRHNYGVAVDLTIATNDGTPLDMGAEFDDFTDAASVKGSPDTSDASTRTIEVYREYVQGLVSRGIIGYEAAQNRILLLEVMLEAGLYPYRREWWHYEDIMSMNTVRAKYKLLDF